MHIPPNKSQNPKPLPSRQPVTRGNHNTNLASRTQRAASKAVASRTTSSRSNNHNLHATVKTPPPKVQDLADQAGWPKERQKEIDALKDLLKDSKENQTLWKEVAAKQAVWDFWKKSERSLASHAEQLIAIRTLAKDLALDLPVLELIHLGQPLAALGAFLTRLKTEAPITRSSVARYQEALTYIADLQVMPCNLLRLSPKVLLAAVSSHQTQAEKNKNKGHTNLKFARLDRHIVNLIKKFSDLNPETKAFHERYLSVVSWLHDVGLSSESFGGWASCTTPHILDVFMSCKDLSEEQKDFIAKNLPTLGQHPNLIDPKAMTVLFQSNLDFFQRVVYWIDEENLVLAEKALALVIDHEDALRSLTPYLETRPSVKNVYNLFLLIEFGGWNRPTKRGRVLFNQGTLNEGEFNRRLLMELERHPVLKDNLSGVLKQLACSKLREAKAPWESILKDLLFLPIALEDKNELLSLINRLPHHTFAQNLVEWVATSADFQRTNYKGLSSRAPDLFSLLELAQSFIDRQRPPKKKTSGWIPSSRLIEHISSLDPRIPQLFADIEKDAEFGATVLRLVASWVRANLSQELFNVLPSNYSKLSTEKKKKVILSLKAGLIGYHAALVEEQKLPMTSLRYQVLQSFNLKPFPKAFAALMRRDESLSLEVAFLEALLQASKNLNYPFLISHWDHLRKMKQTGDCFNLLDLLKRQGDPKALAQLQQIVEFLKEGRTHAAIETARRTGLSPSFDNSPMNPLLNPNALSLLLSRHEVRSQRKLQRIASQPSRTSLSEVLLHEKPYYATPHRWVTWSLELASHLMQAEVSCPAIDTLLGTKIPDDFEDTDYHKYIKNLLELLKSDKNLREKLRYLPKDFTLGTLGKKMVQKLLKVEGDPTPQHILTAVLSALLCWPRQNNYEGSCFADALIISQHSTVEGLSKIVDEYLHILQTGTFPFVPSNNKLVSELHIDESLLQLDMKNLPMHPLARARKLALATLGHNREGRASFADDARASMNLGDFIKHANLSPAEAQSLSIEVELALRSQLLVMNNPVDLMKAPSELFIWRIFNAEKKSFVYNLDDYVHLLAGVLESACLRASLNSLLPLIPSWADQVKHEIAQQKPDTADQSKLWASDRAGGRMEPILASYQHLSMTSYPTSVANGSELAKGLSFYLADLIDNGLIDAKNAPSMIPIRMPGHAFNLMPQELLTNGDPSSFLQDLQRSCNMLGSRICSIEEQEALNKLLGLSALRVDKECTVKEWAIRTLHRAYIKFSKIHYKKLAYCIDAVLCQQGYLTADMVKVFADPNWHVGNEKKLFAFGPSFTLKGGVGVFEVNQDKASGTFHIAPYPEDGWVGQWSFVVPF